MSELRQRMTEDLRLAGYAERTIASYVGTVKCLSKYYGRSPDTLSEARNAAHSFDNTLFI